MKRLKTYELFKKKGNYLTKQDQPKGTFNEYLYDNGFGDRFYICSECDSYKLTPISKGGMQSPEWHCDNCGELNYSPTWKSPEEYKDYIKDKFQVGDYFIYKDGNHFYLLKFLSINDNQTYYAAVLQPLFNLIDNKIKRDKRSAIEYPGIQNLKSSIIYYSKDLDTVKERLEEILFEKETKKYNL